MASTRGRQVVIPMTNKSGGSVAPGDVVVIDSSNDTAFTTTTTGRAEVSLGVAQDTIANNGTGRVLVAGYAALINVPASVTRGHYIETHTVAKQATGNSTRRSGSFGQFFIGGTTPTGWLWGQTDQTASGGAGGSLVWLQRQTASASATLDFTSFISSTYDKYMFEIVNLMPATTNTNLLLRMGTGGGPTYDSGTNYGWAGFRNSPTGSTHAGNSASQTSIVLDASGGVKSDAALPLDGTFYLYNPSSTAATKRFMGHVGYVDNAGAIINATVDGIYVITTAVTAIRFLMSSGNITSGAIDCYGLTKA